MNGRKSTRETKELTKLEQARIHYLFLCLFSEGSKFLIMYIIFHALHMTGEYLITLIVLLSVRNFSGGIHLKHYTSCLAFTFTFVFSIILVSRTLVLTPVTESLILLAAALILLFTGPVTSTSRPDLSPEQNKVFRRTGAVIILIYAALLFCMRTLTCHDLIFWVIVFQILQLIAAKMIKERREHHEKLYEEA